MPAYAQALEKLAARDLLYPCFSTRKDIAREIAEAGRAPHGPEGPVYPGTCRHLSKAERTARIAAGAPYAERLRMDRAMAAAGPLTFTDREAGRLAVDGTPFGDVVLARKEVPASYHLAVVVDDAAQGVTLVSRGKDLLPATHVHRILQALLGLPEPAYAHHRLLADAAGRRFAKRDKSLTIDALRRAGRSPDEVRRMAGIG
jgi:glutamyl-Q tRNA(Asp) synthetase